MLKEQIDKSVIRQFSSHNSVLATAAAIDGRTKVSKPNTHTHTNKAELNEKDMRTRLASLIIVKQEPLSNDDYLDSEQDAILNYNDVDSQFYGLSDSRRDFFHTNHSHGDLNNNLNNNSIAIINNNNINDHDQEEFDEDKKCTYFIFLVFIFIFADFCVFYSRLSRCMRMT